YAACITDSYSYDAFGILIAETHPGGGATPNSYLYCGEQFDPDLGLYYLRARYLSPGIGRFSTVDRFDGETDDPPSLHRYLYTQSSPVDRFDPSGQYTSVIEFGIASSTLAGITGHCDTEHS